MTTQNSNRDAKRTERACDCKCPSSAKANALEELPGAAADVNAPTPVTNRMVKEETAELNNNPRDDD